METDPPVNVAEQLARALQDCPVGPPDRTFWVDVPLPTQRRLVMVVQSLMEGGWQFTPPAERELTPVQELALRWDRSEEWIENQIEAGMIRLGPELGGA